MLNEFGEETTGIFNTKQRSDAEIGRLAPTPLSESDLVDDKVSVRSTSVEAAQNEFAEIIGRDQQRWGNLALNPTAEMQERFEAARMRELAQVMVAHPDRYSEAEYSGMLKSLMGKFSVFDEKTMSAFKTLDSDTQPTSADYLSNFLGFLDEMDKAKSVEEKMNVSYERALDASPAYRKWLELKNVMSREELASYAKNELDLEDDPDVTDLIKRTADNMLQDVSYDEMSAWMDTLPKERRNRYDSIRFLDIPHPELKDFHKERDAWVEQGRIIDKYEGRFAEDKARAEGMKLVPFLTKGQRDLLNIAASGADMTPFRGIVDAMRSEDRQMMTSLIGAFRPEYRGNFFEKAGAKVGQSVSDASRNIGYWWDSFGVSEEEAKILASQQKEDIAWAAAALAPKMADPKGFVEKAFYGMADSAALQGSAFSGSLLIGAGKAVPHPVAKGLLIGTGVALEGFGWASMCGEQYKNQLLHGVDPRMARNIGIFAGTTDFLIENLDFSLISRIGGAATKISAAQLHRAGMRGVMAAFTSRSFTEIYKAVGENMARAATISLSECGEEFLQALNREGFLKLGKGEINNIITDFVTKDTVRKAIHDFADALPTCTLFGFTGAADFLGTARASAENNFQAGLMAIAKEKAKRDNTGEVSLSQEADAYVSLLQTVKKAASAMMGKSRKEQNAYINSLEGLTDAERAACSAAADYYSSLMAQEGEQAAKDIISGNINEGVFHRTGMKIYYGKDGNIASVRMPDGKRYKVKVVDRAMNLSDLSESDKQAFVDEYNEKIARAKEAVANGEDIKGTALEEFDTYSEISLDTLTDEMVSRAPGMSTKDGVTLFQGKRETSKRIESELSKIDAEEKAKEKKGRLGKAKEKIKASLGLGDNKRERAVRAAARVSQGYYSGTLAHELSHQMVSDIISSLKPTMSKAERKEAEKSIAALRAKLGKEYDEALAEKVEDTFRQMVFNYIPSKTEENRRTVVRNFLNSVKRAVKRGEQKGETLPNVADTNGKILPVNIIFESALREAVMEYDAREADLAKRREEEEALRKKHAEELTAEEKAELDALKAKQDEEAWMELEAEEASKAEREAQEAKMLENRKKALKTPPRLIKGEWQSDEDAERAMASYRSMWNVLMGKRVSQKEVDRLMEVYSLPPEALNLVKTGKGWKLSDKQILSAESLMRLTDELNRFHMDVTSVRIAVKPVVVSSAEEAAYTVPNEVYDPITDTFVKGSIIVDSNAARSFREEAGMEEPTVSPQEIEEAMQRREAQRKMPSGKQKDANTEYPDAADIRFSIGTGTMNAVRDFAQGKDSFIENEYGRIVYDFGNPGHITPSGKVKGGHGILHIVYSRMMKDGVSLTEAVDTAVRVADAIETGKETLSVKNKRYFRKGDIEGIFADNGDGKLVLTGYKIIADGVEGASLVSSDLRTQPPPRKEEVVAALNDWMNNHPTPHNVPQSAAGVNGGGGNFSISAAMPEGYDGVDAEGRTRFSIAAESPLYVRDIEGEHEVLRIEDVMKGRSEKELREFLRKNPEAYVRLYHGTGAQLEGGLKRTSAKTRRTSAVTRGYVYLSANPATARRFGEFGYDGNASVWAADVKVKELKPDGDSIFLSRQNGRDIERDDLAASLFHTGNARVKRDIAPWEISPTRFSISAAEAKAQYDVVYNRYHNADGTAKPGWMKAPNGKPTKLTEWQWVLVRTPAFKKWFGDWEAIAEISGYSLMDAKSMLQKKIKAKTEISTADGIVVAFSGQAKKVWSKEAEQESDNSAAHWAAVGNIENLIGRAIRLWEESPRNNSADIRAYVKHGAVFTFNGVPYLAKITTKSYPDADKQNLYSLESVSVEKINAHGIHKTITKRQSIDVSDERNISQLVDSVKSVSKVVDENGEPMVVYHGTNNNFTIFSAEKMRPGAYGDGFYFATTPERARLYGDRIISVFLNAKADNRDAKRLGVEKDYIRTSAGDIIVKNPEQIKSATDNIGTFDSQNPDIRFSIGGIFTGSAADYEKPSLHYVGSGEGTQVYGWGLYGSTVRDVAEVYMGRRKQSQDLMYKGQDIAPVFKFPRNATPKELALKFARVSSSVDGLLSNLEYEGMKDKSYKSQYTAAVEWVKTHRDDFSERPRGNNLYEQTFFTDRAPGDESHLLIWYGNVSDPRNNFSEQEKWIRAQAKKEGVKLPRDLGGWGADIYNTLANILGSPKAASEFLARAGIDGVKYPVDSYGKTVKDGDKVGWNYVSFRDDNIRVDHKWVDGQTRFSINPNLREEVEAALNTDKSAGKVEKGGVRVNFCDAPPLFRAIGISDGKVYSKAYILRKIAKDHNWTSEQIASAPNFLEYPAAVFDDHGNGYIFLTEAEAMDEDGKMAPVMFYLREDSEGNFIASAYARKEKAESKYVNLVNAGKVLYFDKNKVTRLPLRGEAQSSLNTFNAGDKVITPERVTSYNVPQPAGAVNGENISSAMAEGEGLAKIKDLLKPRKPSNRSAQFSISRNAEGYREDISHYVVAKAILENGGRVPDAKTLDSLAKSVYYNGSKEELLRRAMKAADETRRLMRVIASDKELEKMVARAGLAGRYERSLTRYQRANLQFARQTEEAREANEQAIQRAVRAVRGEDYDEMARRMGLDFNAILLGLQPKERAKGEKGETAESPADPAKLTQADLDAAEALARQAIEEGVKAVAEAKEKAKENPIEPKKKPESAGTPSAEGNAESAKDGATKDDDAMESAVAQAIRDVIAKSGITVDDIAGLVKLCEVITEKYIRENPQVDQAFDPDDIWSSPIARTMLSANIASFATAVAHEYAPSYARIRIAERCKALGSPNVSTFKQIEETALSIFADLNRDIIRQSRASLIKDIHKTIDRLANGHKQNELKQNRKVTAEVGEWLGYVRKAINASAADVEAECERLEAILESYATTPEGKKMSKDEASRYRDYAKAEVQLAVYDQFGNLKGRMPAEIREAKKYIENMVENGKLEALAYSEKHNRVREKVAERIKDGIAADPKNGGVKPDKRGALYSLVGMWETKARQLTMFCKDSLKQARARNEFERLETLIQRAQTNKTVYMEEQRKKVLQLCRDVYGSDSEAKKALYQTIDQSLWAKLDRGEQRTEWTIGRALQMYVSIVQDDYSDNVDKWGRGTDYLMELEAIINSIDPRHMDFVRGLREMYMEQGDDLSKVLMETTGTRLRTPNRNYMPVKMHQRKARAKNMEVRAFSPFAPALTPRVKNGLDFDQSADILDVYFDRLQQTAHTIAYSKIGPLVMGVCQSDRVINKIEDCFGNDEARAWNDYILDIFAGPKVDNTNKWTEGELLQTAAKLTSFMWLWGNVSSGAKQLSSVMTYALSSRGSLGDVVRSLGYWLKSPADMLKIAHDLSQTRAFRARYGAAIAQELKYVTNNENLFATWLQKYVFDPGMKHIMLFDKLGVFMLAGIYKERREDLENAGRRGDDASELAAEYVMFPVDNTAQSSRTLNQTAIQRAGGAWNAILQFSSASVQQTQFEITAFQEWKASGFGVNEKGKKFATTVLINHVLVPSFIGMVNALTSLLTSWGIPDEDERKRFLAMLIGNMIAGPLGSIVILGGIIEGAANVIGAVWAGIKPSIYTFLGSSSVPSDSLLKMGGRVIFDLWNAISEVEEDDINETAIKMAEAMGKLTWPTRTATKAIKSAEEK